MSTDAKIEHESDCPACRNVGRHGPRTPRGNHLGGPTTPYARMAAGMWLSRRQNFQLGFFSLFSCALLPVLLPRGDAAEDDDVHADSSECGGVGSTRSCDAGPAMGERFRDSAWGAEFDAGMWCGCESGRACHSGVDDSSGADELRAPLSSARGRLSLMLRGLCCMCALPGK